MKQLVSELVKNAYDADTTDVQLIFDYILRMMA
jgi:hypothetical protein